MISTGGLVLESQNWAGIAINKSELHSPILNLARRNYEHLMSIDLGIGKIDLISGFQMNSLLQSQPMGDIGCWLLFEKKCFFYLKIMKLAVYFKFLK